MDRAIAVFCQFPFNLKLLFFITVSFHPGSQTGNFLPQHIYFHHSPPKALPPRQSTKHVPDVNVIIAQSEGNVHLVFIIIRFLIVSYTQKAYNEDRESFRKRYARQSALGI